MSSIRMAPRPPASSTVYISSANRVTTQWHREKLFLFYFNSTGSASVRKTSNKPRNCITEYSVYSDNPFSVIKIFSSSLKCIRCVKWLKVWVKVNNWVKKYFYCTWKKAWNWLILLRYPCLHWTLEESHKKLFNKSECTVWWQCESFIIFKISFWSNCRRLMLQSCIVFSKALQSVRKLHSSNTYFSAVVSK